jgi:ribosomal protein L37E
MFDRLRQAFAPRTDGKTFAECRRCGTRVDDPHGACGCCGSTDVAQYDL